jgi:EAL domain-containing protein (putative c-di-GMP-specific phosphodiesterase class I)
MQAPGASLGILNALQASGLAPHRLELEITETALLDTNPQVKDFVAAIDEVGIKMALDDFGTGYSSLSYLHQYNFSKIKVDSSFVSGALAGKKSDAIIKAVAELANTLDMNIVAEGIETEEQAASVLAVGCRQGQGYLFGAAMPSAKVDALLALGGRIAQAA